MSFNKRYIPDLPDLIKMRGKHSSDEEFILFIDNLNRKADALLGSSESFEYLREMREKIKADEQGLGDRS
jgi:hypothetical protein